MEKRFTKEFKLSQTEHTHELFMRVIGQKLRGKTFTVFMVINWFHGRNRNKVLDKELLQLLIDNGVEIPDDAYEPEEVMA